MTSEIEACCYVHSRRYVKQRTTSPPKVLNPIYRSLKRLRIQRPSVPDSPEVRYRDLVVPVPHRYYPRACYHFRKRDRGQKRCNGREAQQKRDREAKHFRSFPLFLSAIIEYMNFFSVFLRGNGWSLGDSQREQQEKVL